MNVSGTGKGPISYQWFVGTRGNTSEPIDGASGASYTTPAMTETTNYWVRLSDGTATADSNTALIAVAPADAPGSPPPAGTAPSITTQPQSQTINSGQTATLSVGAEGTGPLSLQWYQGASGTTSSPVSGATGATFTTPALTATTSYWVRVSNAFGTSDSSDGDHHGQRAAPGRRRAVHHASAAEPDDHFGPDRDARLAPRAAPRR